MGDAASSHGGADGRELGVDRPHRRRRRLHHLQILRGRRKGRGGVAARGDEGGGIAAHNGHIGAEVALMLLAWHAAQGRQLVSILSNSISLQCPDSLDCIWLLVCDVTYLSRLFYLLGSFPTSL